MRRRGQDGGSVMVVVLVLFIALSLTVLATVSYVSQGTKHSRYEQDVERANAAAASGLADLVSLLRADPQYLRQVTPATKDKADGYCKNEAAGGPDGDVLAGVCGWGATTPARWKPVDAAEGDSGEFYHYAVRRLPIDAERIDVEVTGKANGVYRTVKASVARESSSMWLYITNYELADPTDIISYASSRSIYESQGALTAPACGGGWTVDHTPPELGYAWQVGTGSPPKPPRIYRYGSVTINWEYACTQPTFIDVDVLAGRIHSNDTVQSRGAQFIGEFSTAMPECKQADAGKPDTWSKCLSSGSWADFGAMPQYREPIKLPSVTNPNSLSLNGQGCRYEGATRIIFNADGTMRVWAKDTTADSIRPGCGDLGALTSQAGALVQVPDDGLIFVAASPTASQRVLYTGEIGGPTGRELPLGNYTPAPAGTPRGYRDSLVERNLREPEMFKGVGNAYLEGVFSGRLTVATERNIVVTGDLMAADKNSDLLGLVSGHAVDIYRPKMIILAEYCPEPVPGVIPECYPPVLRSRDTQAYNTAGWPTDYDGNPKNLELQAAVVASVASLRVQSSSDLGSDGVLHLYGSLAQNFRGAVGVLDPETYQATGGYAKHYEYNPLLNTQVPPGFPSLVNGEWVVTAVTKAEPSTALKN